MPTATKKAPAKTRAPKKKAVAKTVNRDLLGTSPVTKGQDVRALQSAVNKELRHRKLGWHAVKVDGQLGPQTLRACSFLGWVLGFSARQYKDISPAAAYVPTVSQKLQTVLRDPQKRSAVMRTRERLRKSKVAALRKRHSEGPAAAIAEGRRLAAEGVHEVGESNTGTWVDKFTGQFGLHAVPWCGCFAGWLAIKFGHCKAAALSFWYGPALMQQAAEHADGCYPVPFDKIEGGEILVLWEGDHVVTAAAASKGDTVETVEGNTSPTDGNSQADGGAVAVKTRSRSDVTVAIRIYG